MGSEMDLNVRLALESQSFQQQITAINRQMAVVKSEFASASTALGGFGSATEKLKAQSASLSQQIDIGKNKVTMFAEAQERSRASLEKNVIANQQLKQRLDETNKAYQTSVTATGKTSTESLKLKEELAKLQTEYKNSNNVIANNSRTLDNYAIKTNKAQKSVNDLERELKNVDAEIATQNSKWTTLGATMTATGEKMQAVGGKMSKVGRDLTLAVTVPLVAIGAKAIKTGMDFEAGMSKVKAISGATGDSFEKLNEQALQLGKDTAFSAGEAAGGMENLASAGFDVNEIMSAMPGMLDLAASGGLDVATASDIASSALRGFGLDASQSGHFADVLAKAAADTNANVTDMGMSLKYAAPPAHALGMSVEEVSAAIGIMANAGIKGETAGTTLRGSLISLASPSKEAAELMETLGFNAFDAQGKMLPFKDVVDELQKSTAGLSQEKKADALATIFGKEALSGMMTIVDAGPAKIDELTKSFEGSDGAAKAMADTMKDNTKGSIDEMMGSLETAAIKIQKAVAPAIISIAEKVQALADKFSELSPEAQENIIKFGLFAIAAGPVILGLGKLITIGGTLAKVFGGISTAIGLTTAASVGTTAAVAGIETAGIAAATGTAGVGVAMGGVVLAAAPFVLAGAAIAGVGYAVYKGMTDTATPSVELFGDAVKTTTESVKDSNGKLVESSVNTMVKISDSTQKSVGAYIKLDDDATKSLTNLFVNSTVITGQITTDMTTKFNTMGTAIKAGIDKSFTDSYGITQKFFVDSKVLTETEETKILTDMTAKNEAKKAETDSYTKQIQAILKTASDANKALTLDEQTKINEIQNIMKTTAVKTMSDGEVESKAILERLKLIATQITTEQASAEIKNAVAAKDGSITAANEKYNQTVASVIRMRDETGVISAEQADKLIADAKRQKDESVAQAEALKTQVVEKITSMNSETSSNVDTNTGNIITAWGRVKTWWDSWFPEAKTATVNTNYTSSGVPPEDSSAGSNGMIYNNASGTNYFPGGLTTMNEEGYEIFNLPTGSKIYNHQASEDMVLKTAKEVAKGVLANSNSGGNSGTQTIIVPIHLDGKEIARVIAPYSDQIQGRNLKLAGRGVGL